MESRVFSISHCITDFIKKNIEVFLFILFIYVKTLAFNIALSVGQTIYTILACFGSAMTIASISFLFKKRTRFKLLVIFDLVLSIIMIADVVYYRYYSDVFSIPVLMQAKVVDSSLKNSIVSLVRPWDFFFLTDFLIFIGFLIAKRKNKIEIKEYRFRQRLSMALAALIIGSALVATSFYQLNKAMGFKSLTTVYDHGFILANIGVLNYHGFDSVFYVFNNLMGKKMTDQEKNQVKTEVKNHQKETANEYSGVAKGKNLIIIQVESMQNLVLNMKIDGQEVTPNLNKFASESLYFDNYYSQTGQGNTSDAEFITNNSFFALPQGTVYFTYPNNKFASLGNILKKDGYSTMAMHGYKASYWNRATVYPALGFDKFISDKDFNITKIFGWGLSDDDFFDQSLGYLNNIKKPFYSFMITLSSHYPFDNFEDYGDFNTGKYEGTFFGNYLKAMHYVDNSIGNFLKDLDKQGILKDSVIAIYGDHEAIKMENVGDIQKDLNLPGNLDIVVKHMANVPLIIHIPGNTAHKKISNYCGQIDFLPTIANIMGFKQEYGLGRDLLSSKDSYVIFRDGSITDGKKIFLKKYEKVYDYNTGEEVEAGDFQKYIDKAPEELTISDTVLKNNLIDYFEKNK